MKAAYLKSLSTILAVALVFSACSSTKVAKDFNGLSSPDGEVIGHLSTSHLAVHLIVGKKPFLGNASLPETVSDFTASAKAMNARKVRIVQSNVRSWWFIFFPFTLLFTPVTSNVAGEAIA